MGELFNKDFYQLENDEIKLSLINIYEGNEKALPFYWWNIVPKEVGKSVGKISFRLGNNYHSYFNGNIGYEVDEEHRGHHYSLKACQLLIAVAKHYRMDFVYITCDFNNYASIKIIEYLGADFIEEVVPPKDYVFYFEGIPKHRIYRLKIK